MSADVEPAHPASKHVLTSADVEPTQYAGERILTTVVTYALALEMLHS